MTFIAPGIASMRPTVPTISGNPAAMRSIASTHSAAAASASRRSAIGTVPACPAMPVSSMLKRLPPLIAVTTPVARPSASSTGPCSICNSAYASTSPGRRATAPIRAGSSPKPRKRIAHRDSGSIDRIEQCMVEGSRHRPAAEQRRAEAHALLVAEPDDLDGERQAYPAGMERTHAFDRRDHAEHAVVLAGVAHRVEVRTEHEAREFGTLALVAARAVADGIHACRHAGVAHPGQHVFVCIALLVGKEHARQAALLFGEAAEHVATVLDALRLQDGK